MNVLSFSSENSYPLLEIQTSTSPPFNPMFVSIVSAFGEIHVIEVGVANELSAKTSKYLVGSVLCSNQHFALRFEGS